MTLPCWHRRRWGEISTLLEFFLVRRAWQSAADAFLEGHCIIGKRDLND
jgi:hypothetical protein